MDSKNNISGSLLFLRSWKFNLGDVDGAEIEGYDDGAWRSLDLPHDWSIEQPFDPAQSAEQGHLPGGIGWYRKTFDIPESYQGKIVRIEFDGVYMDSTVWINGHLLGGRPYGYIGFSFDLTPYLRFGEKNVLTVKVNAQTPSCRWYSGAGIYRNVRLAVQSETHIPQCGVFITAPEIESSCATVRIVTSIENHGSAKSVELKTVIQGTDGAEVAFDRKILSELSGKKAEYEQLFKIKSPRLWSCESPYLYKAVSIVSVNGGETDRKTTVFGIRKIEFTRDRGFFLNDIHTPIKGLCMHHDLGCLGAAVNVRAMERQLEILKASGCNAIRTAHNPPAPEFLDLCDRMGFLVNDEVFDEWKAKKTEFGYWRFFDEWHEADVTDFIRRDRNHPSVIMWSIGNEIDEQRDKENGAVLAQALADIVHREDPTRPVTAGCNYPQQADEYGYMKVLDVAGINYNYQYYPVLRGRRPLFGSETTAATASRGEYKFIEKNGEMTIDNQRPENHQATSYCLNKMPGGALQEDAIRQAKNHPWSAGEFVWSGFDYLGEPFVGWWLKNGDPYIGEWTPDYAMKGWPSRSSCWGLVDTCGFPKDRYYFYQSQWGAKAMVHILPHWTWPEHEGKLIPLWCYAQCDSVELFLNGKSLGEKKFIETADLHLEWKVPYAPGTLRACAKINGREIASDEVHTAGEPYEITLSPDRKEITADGYDLSFITARITDRNGVTCPEAAMMISFSVGGSGAIAGVDNGDATCRESFKTAKHSAFHGLALLVIKSLCGKPGTITVLAMSDGLKIGETAIQSI